MLSSALLGAAFHFSVFPLLEGHQVNWLWLWIVMGLLMLIVLIELYLSRFIDVIVKEPIILTGQAEEENARKGIIVFLSLLNFSGAGCKELQKRRRLAQEPSRDAQQKIIEEALKSNDWNAVLLDGDDFTTFGQTTRAIKTHLHKLQKVWIISTESTKDQSQSSKRFVPLYKEFLEKKILSSVSKTIEIDTNSFVVNTDQQSLVMSQTCEKIRKIYRAASKKPLKIKPKEIIVDVTGGLSHMTVGAVLASIEKERDIQIITSEYRADGPKAFAPTIYRYEAKLIPSTGH